MRNLGLVLALTGMFFLSGCWGCKECVVPTEKEMTEEVAVAEEAVPVAEEMPVAEPATEMPEPTPEPEVVK